MPVRLGASCAAKSIRFELRTFRRRTGRSAARADDTGRLFASRSLWIKWCERRERGGARLTRRAREEPPPGELAPAYCDRSATMSDVKR